MKDVDLHNSATSFLGKHRCAKALRLNLAGEPSGMFRNAEIACRKLAREKSLNK